VFENSSNFHMIM